MRFFLVITSSMGMSVRETKRRSRLVRMPTRRPLRVTGTPDILKRRMSSSASAMGCSGEMVTGSTIMPDSDRLTLSISPACCAMVRLRWTTPNPPCWAMAMARRDSVTVSMAADISGVVSVMRRVSWVWVLTWVGTTSLYAGTSRTSSKVRASGIGVVIICQACRFWLVVDPLFIVGWLREDGRGLVDCIGSQEWESNWLAASVSRRRKAPEAGRGG